MLKENRFSGDDSGFSFVFNPPLDEIYTYLVILLLDSVEKKLKTAFMVRFRDSWSRIVSKGKPKTTTL
jgi:hypothetical protein